MATVKPIADWTYEDAKVHAAADLPKDLPFARRLIEDEDHWLGGAGWSGYRTGDPVTDAALLKNAEAQFIPDDIASELVENRTNGLLGREADVTLQPLEPAEEGTTAEEAQQDEIEAIVGDLSTWWDEKDLWGVTGLAVNRMSYARRATVRPFVAEGNLIGNALPTGKTRLDALRLVDLEAPLSEFAKLYTDPKTRRKAAVIITGTEDEARAEVWTVDPVTKQTQVKVLTSGATQAGAIPPMDLKGRLPLGEITGRRILTEPMRKLQALVNFITTAAGRTVGTASSRERYLGNVEPPGLWLPSAPANSPPLAIDSTSVPGTTFYKHRVDWKIGDGISNELVGLKTLVRTASGEEREEYATPFVQALDPVDPEYATKALAKVKQEMYERARQGHLALDSTSEASGTAYQQARAQFEADLNTVRGRVERCVRDVIEAALAYAGLMSTEAQGILDRYRVVVTLHIHAGPVTPDEARLATELRDKRAISQQTMQARLGIEDPVAEQEAIDADPMTRAEFWSKMAGALQVLTGIAGAEMTAEGAGFLLGLSLDQLEVLRTGRPPAPKPGDGVPDIKVVAA